jgi:hypothetical protein
MLRQENASKLYRYACLAIVFFVAASASFQGYYQKWHFREPGIPGGVGDRPGDNFDFAHILDGSSDRPYIYRQLIPTTVKWIDAAIPENTRSWFFRKYGIAIQRQDTTFISPVSKDPVYFVRYQIFYYLNFLFAFVAAIAMFLVCRALNFATLPSAFASVLMTLIIPYMMSNGGYYYDYPELAFLALAVWMSMRFDWWWLIPLVALGTWNKESFLLAVLSLYPLLRHRASRWSALAGAGILALTAVAVYFALRLHFAGNPGSTVLFKLQGWLTFFAHPQKFFLTEATYGIKAFKAFSPIPVALLIWTTIRGWKHLPRPVRQHAVIAAVINFPLFFLFCSPGEMRDLSLLYMVLLLLFAVNLAPQTDARLPGPTAA